MPRAHLTIRETPLESGSQVEALCGAQIFPAQIVLMWDSVLMGEPLAVNTLLVCRKCWGVAALAARIYELCRCRSDSGILEGASDFRCIDPLRAVS